LLIRPKVFLTFLAIILVPLLLLLFFDYANTRRSVQASLEGEVDNKLDRFTTALNQLLRERETEITQLAQTEALREAVDSGDFANPSADVRIALASLLNNQSKFTAIACFNRNHQQLFLAERKADSIAIRSKDFLPGQLQPDPRVWNTTGVFRSPVSRDSLRTTLTLTTPILAPGSVDALGALVGEVNVDSLFRAAAGDWAEETNRRIDRNSITVLDHAGRVLYHPNSVFIRQTIPAPVNAIRQKEISDLQLIAMADYPPPQSAWRDTLRSLLFAILLAGGVAFLLARAWERRTSSIDRVTRGVAAIAGGDLNHRIETLSSDSIRPLSDDLNRVTAQLREQIARETEARQFQSFVRLSAMLTHDLKNAIESLSLIVSNMERHFDNPTFRADAMKSLNLAAKNLRSLVDRLSNPVNTLSGEYKRPRPVDLVPLINGVISMTAQQAGETHVETRLPASLFALVDGERVEKVIENLVLNALESMAGKSGTLTITAGPAENEKVFFSVGDTGGGMSKTFIENQLYRPFATTKKKGVGLGLYTCREFVRANGGTIAVDSREGAGTTFRVVLPSASIERPD
jgi:signal transduction histidine kinase